MDLRDVFDRAVEAAQPQQHDGLVDALGHQVRAAPGAKAANLPGEDSIAPDDRCRA
jgi:hypothetical protein